jgi:hypothetical protein
MSRTMGLVGSAARRRAPGGANARRRARFGLAALKRIQVDVQLP